MAQKASSNPTKMWKRLKALLDKKPAHILLEIIKDDGSISSDIKDFFYQSGTMTLKNALGV